jgi:toxin HigB-1
MRSNGIVLATPGLDHDARFATHAEPIGIQALIALPSVYQFVDPVLRGPARIDMNRLNLLDVTRFRNIERVARRKLLQLHVATESASLRIPPGNQLEGLKGDRRGQHSIRINGQRRICFVWMTDGAHHVEIVDYHQVPSDG